MKKIFSLRDILTVTTGRLLTKPEGERDNGIGGLYKILEHMTGDAPFTHALGRFAEECKPYLLEKYPELNGVDLEDLDQDIEMGKGIEDWLDRCVDDHGMNSEYSVEQIPTSSHVVKHPVTELTEMMEKR